MRENFHFGLSDTNKETLPKMHTCYFPQGWRIHGLGLGFSSGKLAQQVSELLNKSLKVYLRMIPTPFLSLDC